MMRANAVDLIYGDGLTQIGVANIVTAAYRLASKWAEACDNEDEYTIRLDFERSYDHPSSVLVVEALNETQFLTGCVDGNCRLWSAYQNEEDPLLHTFRGHTRPVLAIVRFDDGNQFLSVSSDRTIRQWRVPVQDALGPNTGTQNAVRSYVGHEGAVTCVAFLPVANGESSIRFVTGSRDGTVRLWEIGSEAPVQQPFSHDAELPIVRRRPAVLSVASVSHSAFLALTEDGRVSYWDVNGQEPTLVNPPSISHRILLCMDFFFNIVSNLAPTMQVSIVPDYNFGSITSTIPDGNGNPYFLVGIGTKISIWQQQQGDNLRWQRLQRISFQSQPDFDFLLRLAFVQCIGAIAGFVTANENLTSIAPIDGNRFVAVSDWGNVQLFGLGDGNQWTRIHKYLTSGYRKTSVCYLGGNSFVTGSVDRSAKLWSLPPADN